MKTRLAFKGKKSAFYFLTIWGKRAKVFGGKSVSNVGAGDCARGPA